MIKTKFFDTLFNPKVFTVGGITMEKIKIKEANKSYNLYFILSNYISLNSKFNFAVNTPSYVWSSVTSIVF